MRIRAPSKLRLPCDAEITAICNPIWYGIDSQFPISSRQVSL